MIKKYLVPILGIISFVSFVAYATAQTKSIPQPESQPESQTVEEINEVSQNDDMTAFSPEVASANTSIDTIEALGGQNSITLPVEAPIVEEVQEPVITPTLFTDDDVEDDEFESEDQYSEDSRYEEEEDEDDDD